MTVDSTFELIDSHCHLTFDGLREQVDDVLDRARAAGVTRVVTVGTTLTDARAAIALAQDRKGVFVAAGIHPHESAAASHEDIRAIEELWSHPRVVAAGEMGLDYHYDFSDRPSQRRVFAGQLDRARATDKPIIIHCREAHTDTVAMLEAAGMTNRPVVFHCFTGTEAEARRILDCGWWLSFTGIVTFKNAQELQAIARNHPADRLMLETDAPYLSPVPVRHVRPNEPSFVRHTAAFLATLRDVPLEQLARQATANTERFYRLT